MHWQTLGRPEPKQATAAGPAEIQRPEMLGTFLQVRGLRENWFKALQSESLRGHRVRNCSHSTPARLSPRLGSQARCEEMEPSRRVWTLFIIKVRPKCLNTPGLGIP